MKKVEVYIDFSEIKKSYVEVREFLEQEVGEGITTLNRDIEEDLGIAGDDTYDLIEKFIKKYNLGTKGLDITKHFLSEGEIFGSSVILSQIISLSFIIFFYFIKLITFGYIDLTRLRLSPEYGRKTIGMTFGDLITWHIMGTYMLRSQVHIMTKRNILGYTG
ncbi:MAG: DUF1493 family protein [Niabella sp.]